MYEDILPEYYTIDTLLYSGKYQIDFGMKIINVPYKKMKIKKGKVKKLTNAVNNGNFDVWTYLYNYNSKITIVFPSLTLELTDAEFEQVK